MRDNEGVNRVMLCGRIVREPRWHLQNGDRWLCFTLMTTEVIKTGQPAHEEIHYIRMSDRCPALREGRLKKDDVVFLQGKIKTLSFTDGQNIRRYKTEIIVSQAESLF